MTVAVALGLVAALGYGIGDFLGGLAGRRLGTLPVVFVGQLAGLVVLVPVAALVPATTVTTADVLWGAVAGVGAVGGTLVLLRGFQVGRISVVSPVSSLGAAGLPLVVDLLAGARPSALTSTGMVVGLAAIWLVGSADAADGPRGTGSLGVLHGIVAGVAFAVTFLALDRADPGSGAWPVLAAQLVLVVLAGLLLVVRRCSPAVPRRALPIVAGHGVAGALATVAFLLAARAGLVSVAALIASMSPAITVLLARAVLAERLPPRRVVGLVAALVALALIDVA